MPILREKERDAREKPPRTRLIEERKQRQWSQQELADRIGTTRINISRWEAGLTTPGPYFRTKLCELFGKSAYELELLDSKSPQVGEIRSEATEHTNAPSAETLALWTVPYLRNPHFTGREEMLDQLGQQFSVSGNDDRNKPQCATLTQPQAIKGLGGIGKTQIAVEYAYRAREQNRYTHILWVNAASEEAIITSFVALAELIPSVAAAKEADQHKVVAAIIRWLERCKERWLLIFDNADELVWLEPYLPQRGNGSLLCTTRAHAVGAFAASIDVEKMGLVEGTILLLHRAQRQHASDEDRNEATNIVIALDGFPLALDQAGAYIEETGCSFGDYLQTYQEHHQILLARRGRQATNYPDSVATTWSLSFQCIEQDSPAAELLHLCAFLAPDAIPEELFTEGAAQWPAALREAVADRFTFDHLLEALLRFSLVKRRTEERVLSLHRLVQVVQRDSMGLKEQRHWAERVVRTINQAFPETIEVISWLHCRRYLSQAQACSVLIQDYAFTFVEAASLLQRLASYLRGVALYEQAEPLLRLALQIHEHRLEPESSEMAATLHSLAILYKEQGKYAQAEPLFQQTLRIREQLFGSNHPQIALSLNDLAALYRRQGKYSEAESLFQQALGICEQIFGPAHPKVANTLHNLAVINREQGKMIEAEPFYQRALRIREQALGPEHVEVATSLNGLAVFYSEQGKMVEAEPLFQRAFRIWEQALGPEHPMVAYSLNNLATLYTLQGKYAEAEPLYQRALHIRKQLFGPEHPEVASLLNNLAELYGAQGKDAQAEPLYQRALHIWEQQLGPEYPLVAHPLNSLATLYTLQGKYAEAEPLYQRALHIRKQRRGERHVETARTLHDFAVLQEAQGKQQEAVALYQQALAIREQVLGSQHPKTAETRERLSAVLQAMGKTEQAATLRAAQSCEATLENEQAISQEK